jgi:ADP-dependent NAD(P)H-hydrate dehydratase
MCLVPPADPGTDGRQVDRVVLAQHAPPGDDDASDKFERGQVVVLGGDLETPGGVVLAALAALRAGAGRAHVVTHREVTVAMAVANPELRVSALPDGALGDAHDLAASIAKADAVVVGTGCRDRARAASLVEQVEPLLSDRAVLCLDAAALPVIADRPSLASGRDGRAVLLPNFGEAADLLHVPREVVEDDPGRTAQQAVSRFGSPVAVRGSTTWISAPDRDLFVERAGHPALGTSGSGDVLVGIVAALLARDAEPLGALLWGVHTHARCGEALAARDGGYGLLARDLLERIPKTLRDLARS